MVFDSARFDLRPYTGFETDRFVRRTFCSWEHAGWRSLLVQRFEHVPIAEEMGRPIRCPISRTSGCEPVIMA